MHLRNLILCLALATASLTAFGQGVTTAAISGTVVDGQSDPLPGAIITAIHEPTGTSYSAVTRVDGRFSLFNLRVGGPYTVTANMTGFKTQRDENIFLKLGQNLRLEFKLSVDTVEEELTVVAESGSLINPSKTGATSNVTLDQIQALPTLDRTIEDYARTNPFFVTNADDDGTAALSVAGRNNRYNNILIDGSVNNDLFGLADNGFPGGQANAQPISLEAIQELQLLIAPFDVRQGGFTGGGVNAVTKSGTNEFDGGVFYYTRDDGYVGDGPQSIEFGEFSQDNTGFSVGGPVIKDKLFFFVSGEVKRRESPTNWAIRPEGQSGTGQNFGFYDAANALREFMIQNYGFTNEDFGFNSSTGLYEEQTRNTDSDNYFIRFDYNINDTHQLTLRHNYLDAENLIYFPDDFTFDFPSSGYVFPNETNSTVLQLNSTFGTFFNEFRIAYQTIDDNRGAGIQSRFPWIEIERLPEDGELGTGNFTRREFELGTERFSTANSLKQSILEVTNDLTFFMGDHTITVGTHNEFFTFENLFIRENFGAYQFRTLDDFIRYDANGNPDPQPYRYDVSYSLDPNDPRPAAEFDVAQFGFYAQDEWLVSPNFNITYGLRVDIPTFPDDPTYNPAFPGDFLAGATADDGSADLVATLRTDEMPSELQVSPRFGFNWDISGDATKQLRGGLGVFSGRTPYVWISNQFSNTGIEFQRLTAFSSQLEFNPDPDNQPQLADLQAIGVNPSRNELNVIDPDFAMPQVIRANLAYDHQFDWQSLVATAEFLYTSVEEDIVYKNLNRIADGTVNPVDGRLNYTRRNGDFGDIYFLTNSANGEQTNFNVKLERPNRGDGWSGFASYTWGESTSVNDGSSSQASSNWRFLPIDQDPNNPRETTSNFEVEHRFNLGLTYEIAYGIGKTQFGLFYNHQSGRPYSITFDGDVNGDGQFSNDLIYVPRSADEVEIVNGTWADLDAFISGDPDLDAARGSILERNALREPYRTDVDMRITQQFKFERYKLDFYVDIFNLMNVFDDDAGVKKFAGFQNLSAIEFEGFTEDGRYIIGLNDQVTDDDRGLEIDQLRSRWQGQFGVRFSF